MIDQQEFMGWIQENEGIIYKITRAYESNPTYQKDLFQEIIFQLWKAYPKFRREAKVSTWMYRISLNTSITYTRRKNRQAPTSFDLPEKIDEEDSLKEEQIQQLYNSIRQLNPVDKGLILLYLEGKNYEEIGKIMGITSSNVGTRLGRIKTKLRNLVQTY